MHTTYVAFILFCLASIVAGHLDDQTCHTGPAPDSTEHRPPPGMALSEIETTTTLVLLILLALQTVIYTVAPNLLPGLRVGTGLLITTLSRSSI
jgi:hypothetical protein